VTVDGGHFPVERPQLVVERVERLDVVDVPRLLGPVAVEDQREVVDPVVAGVHDRLPHLTLFGLAVADDDVDPEVTPIDARRERVAEPYRQPLPQRAGRGFDAGETAHVGVSLERRAELPQCLQVVNGEVPGLGQGGVEARGPVALGQDETIPIGVAGLGGVVAKNASEEQDGQDLDHRKRTRWVPRPGRGGRRDDVLTETPSGRFQLGSILRPRLRHRASLHDRWPVAPMKTQRRGRAT
jgi:hypothetical protein